jgi:hypothetical protein
VTRRASIWPLLVSCVLVSGACGSGSAARATTVRLRRGLVLGDSLAYEARFAIARAGEARGLPMLVHAFAYASPCEWRTWLPADLRGHPTPIIGLLTLGNTGANECRRTTFGSEAYFRQYRKDLMAVLDEAHEAGSRVVFFAAPPLAQPARDAVLRRITTIARSLARTHSELTVSDAIRDALSERGGYTETKPCLASETTANGCRDGRIIIRAQPPAPDAGIHLCPLGLVAGTQGVCSVYSSGSVRLAKALVSTLGHEARPRP